MTPQQARLGVHIFTALVIGSVALALANLTWRLLGHTGAEPVLLPGAGAASQAGDLGPILALAPFGVAASVPGSLEGVSGATLKAVFASTNRAASVALIAGADGSVAEYRVGDATPMGVVEQIETEHVVLRTASGQRILGFDTGGGKADPGAASARTVPIRNVPATASQPAAGPSPSGVDAIRALIPPSQQAGPSPPPPPPPPPSPPPVPTSAAPPLGYKVGDSPSAEMGTGAQGNGFARTEALRSGKAVPLSVATG